MVTISFLILGNSGQSSKLTLNINNQIFVILRNPLFYYNPITNSGIVSYFDGKQVIYTNIVEDIPQKPYRIASRTEFKMIIENGDYIADENTFCIGTEQNLNL